MKKITLVIFALSCVSNGFADDQGCTKDKKKASCLHREASALSMMGWGIGLFAAIAVLCALVETNSANTSSSSTTQ